MISYLISVIKKCLKTYILCETMWTWEGKVEREEITVLSLASGRGRSLRTTVPMSIVKHFRLKEKDKLKWEIRAENNNLLIVVRPMKKLLKE